MDLKAIIVYGISLVKPFYFVVGTHIKGIEEKKIRHFETYNTPIFFASQVKNYKFKIKKKLDNVNRFGLLSWPL